MHPRGRAVLRAEPMTCKGFCMVCVVPLQRTVISEQGGQLRLGVAVVCKEMFYCCWSCIFPLTLNHTFQTDTLNLFKHSRSCSCISCTTILSSNMHESLFLDMKDWIFVLFLTKQGISIWDCFWTWQGLLDIYEKPESW